MHFPRKPVIWNLAASLAPAATSHQIPSVPVAEVVRGSRRAPMSFQRKRCRSAWPDSGGGRHLGFFSRRDSRLFVYLHGRSQATVASRDTHEGAGCTCRGLAFAMRSGRAHGTCQKQLKPRLRCPPRLASRQTPTELFTCQF